MNMVKVFGLAAALALGGASAQAVTKAYSNFGPGETFDQGGGDCVSGPASDGCLPGASIYDASPFIAKASGTLNNLDLALSYGSGLNGVSVALVSDNGGVPNEASGALEEWVITNLPTFNYGSPPVKARKIMSKLHPALAAGTRYWVVVMPLGFDTIAYVQPNIENVMGGVWSDNGGTTWAGSLGTEPAFDVWLQ